MDIMFVIFEKDVIEVLLDMFVLVDFWVLWCGFCKMFGLLLEKFEVDYVGCWKFVKVNVDENQEFVVYFQMCSILYVIVFVDGCLVDQFVGVLFEGQLCVFFDWLLLVFEEVECCVVQYVMVEQCFDEVFVYFEVVFVLNFGYDDVCFDLIELLLVCNEVDVVCVEIECLLL